MMKHRKSRPQRSLALLAAFFLAACTAEEKGDYLAVTGGGFIFNYRAAEAFYGLVAEPLRELPDGLVLIAEFEDPGGGDTIIVRQPAHAGRTRFSLQTPPVEGIVKKQDYQVVLRLVDSEGAVLETHERSFRSSLDQTVLPEQPLTIGPGYQPNPARLRPPLKAGDPPQAR